MAALKFADTDPVASLLIPVFEQLTIVELCPGASVDEAAACLCAQDISTVAHLRAALAEDTLTRPVQSLGRRLLRSSRLQYAQPFFASLRDAIEAQCDAAAPAAPAATLPPAAEPGPCFGRPLPRSVPPGQLAHASPMLAVTALAVGGGFVFTGGADGGVVAWRRTDLGCARTLAMPSGRAVSALCVSASHLFCANSEGDTLESWQIPSLAAAPALPSLHTEGITALVSCPAPRPSRIFTASLDGDVRGWDLALEAAAQSSTLDNYTALRGAEPLAAMKAHAGPVLCLAASAPPPEARRSGGASRAAMLLFSGGADRCVVMWDAERLKRLKRLNQPAFSIGVSCVVAVGDALISGSHDLRVWRGGACVAQVRRLHAGQVGALSADGAVCYSGGGEGTVRAHQLPTLQPLGTMRPGGAVQALVVDDGMLLCGTTDGLCVFGAFTGSEAPAPARTSGTRTGSRNNVAPPSRPGPAQRPTPPPGWKGTAAATSAPEGAGCTVM